MNLYITYPFPSVDTDSRMTVVRSRIAVMLSYG